MTRAERSRRDYLIRRNKNPVLEHLKFKKHICKFKGVKFNLDKKWAEANYTGKCQLTGIKFNLSPNQNPFSPTVDRINNKKGYTKANCRVILRAVNAAKGTGTDADMLLIAKAIIKNLTKA